LEYERVSEVVKMVLGDELDKQRKTTLSEVRNMLQTEKRVVLDNECLQSIFIKSYKSVGTNKK
jgi:hypothetical protein